MKISQREARRLKKRVQELESAASAQRRTWVADWPGGIHLTGCVPHSDVIAQVKTARKLGHAVVVIQVDTALQFYALRLATP